MQLEQDDWNIYRGQEIYGLVGLVQELGFHSQCSGKNFKWENAIIEFIFLKSQ